MNDDEWKYFDYFINTYREQVQAISTSPPLSLFCASCAACVMNNTSSHTLLERHIYRNDTTVYTKKNCTERMPLSSIALPPLFNMPLPPAHVPLVFPTPRQPCRLALPPFSCCHIYISFLPLVLKTTTTPFLRPWDCCLCIYIRVDGCDQLGLSGTQATSKAEKDASTQW